MSRAFDLPHRGHVSRSDELFSAAVRRGCRGRNRPRLPFCTVIDTSAFGGRVARRGRSCFRSVPVCAPKTGRRYDQRRLAQFRCERLVYTLRLPEPVLFAGSGPRPHSGHMRTVERTRRAVKATPAVELVSRFRAPGRSARPASASNSVVAGWDVMTCVHRR